MALRVVHLPGRTDYGSEHGNADRRDEDLFNKPVSSSHNFGRLVLWFIKVALDTGVMPRVDDTADYIASIAQAHTSQANVVNLQKMLLTTIIWSFISMLESNVTLVKLTIRWLASKGAI